MDAHCHIEARDYPDLEAVVERMREARVRAVNTGRNLEANREVLRVAAAYPDDFFVAIGVSPHDAQTCDLPAEEGFVRENASKIVAVGEIGLDYHYFKTREEHARQQVVFEGMLALAEELGKPVVVHSRDAESVVAETLKSFNVKALLHCLQVPEAAGWMPEKTWFSLTTLKNTARVRLIENAPFERLLAETDSPFLGKGRNEPANVALVYTEIARLKNAGAGETEERLWGNAGELFSWRA